LKYRLFWANLKASFGQGDSRDLHGDKHYGNGNPTEPAGIPRARKLMLRFLTGKSTRNCR